MEHVIQIGVSVDDDAIQKQVMKTAEEKIIRDIKKDIEAAILTKNRSYYTDKVDISLSTRSEVIVREWLDENSETIVERAAKLIADKVYRSKAWKAKYGEVTADD